MIPSNSGVCSTVPTNHTIISFPTVVQPSNSGVCSTVPTNHTIISFPTVVQPPAGVAVVLSLLITPLSRSLQWYNPQLVLP
jgi:hypothetical protein